MKKFMGVLLMEKVKLSLREKEILDLMGHVYGIKDLIKRWFFYTGVKFLKSRNFSDSEENLLEEMTDFYMKDLDRIGKKDF